MEKKNLQDVMEQFIEDAIKLKRINPMLVVHYQLQLIGSTIPFLHIGFIRYLKSTGQVEPKCGDFSSIFVGQYWEFLIQHYGAIQAEQAMKALHAFWKWSRQKGYIKGQMPPDLKFGQIGVAYPFRININLQQSES